MIVESLTAMNPFTEVVSDDPERAKTIMAKLEVVPRGLVARYEKLRGGVKEGNEAWERDADGCAICRESFLENEEVVEYALKKRPTSTIALTFARIASGLRSLSSTNLTLPTIISSKREG